jgi:cyclase
VGGGVNSIEHVKRLLRAGADKVSINSACYRQPEIVSKGADLFGSQCIVVSIDVFKHPDGRFECFSQSGKVATGKDPVEWAQHMESLGAGELLLTSIVNDGTMTGYDIDLIKHVSDSVRIPVIASGGAGNYEHLYEGLKAGGASAVAAASIFHFTEQTPLEAKKYLKSKGIAVRNDIPY